MLEAFFLVTLIGATAVLFASTVGNARDG